MSKVPSTPSAKPDRVLTQLRRIRGQLDGVLSMYQDERLCVDIVHQVIAARSSLGRVARDLLTSEASRCSRERKIEEFDQILKEVFRY
jgi:CsoR family transcriptional regulator, copper-sensing transcriptional repressor